MADPQSVIEKKMPPRPVSWNRRDVILYALGIGAVENKFSYEDDGDFAVFPTFPVICGFKGDSYDIVPFGTGMSLDIPGVNINPSMILHGQQGVEICHEIPLEGKFELQGKITGFFDKGSGALINTENSLEDASGKTIAILRSGIFVRGAGGFGGPRGPSAKGVNVPPNRAPDAIVEEPTSPHQALLYRLSGDYNPLHADPSLAQMVGYKKPILHGLCSFGIAARAVLKTFGENKSSNFKSIDVRFSSPVLPGNTLVTEMWKEGGKIIFQTKVKETGKVSIANAAVSLANLGAQPKSNKPTASVSSSCKSDAIFADMGRVVKNSPSLVKQVNAIFEFRIKDKGKVFTVDLKNTPGRVFEGKGDQPADTIFTVTDDDYYAISQGKLKPQMAFMRGKLKISGKVMLAQKLTLLSKAAAKL